MALLELTAHSQALRRNIDFLAILPEDTSGMIGMNGKGGKKCPTLYLLHGMSDDHTIWLRRTNIERYAADKGLAVIMPSTDLGFYTDMAKGEPYWTFISKELPKMCRSMFPQLSSRREDTFVAGLSMGGYGALKCGLRASETFSWAAGLSSVADIAQTANAPTLAGRHYWEDILGEPEKAKSSFNDLFAAAEDMAKGKKKPVQLFMWCGTDDFLYDQNIRLRDHLKKLGLPLTYTESPGGHWWSFWDEQIQNVLNWLPLGKEEE